MDALISALAFALLHSLWQGALLAAAAWLTLRVMAHHSVGARHGIAMSFLIAMVLAPIAQLLIYAKADAPLSAGPLSGAFDPRFNALAAQLMLGAWLAGVALMFARHVAGARSLTAMERKPSVEAPRHLVNRGERFGRILGLSKGVAVRLTEHVATPCVAGAIRPIVWFPEAMLTRTPADQVDALLAHELAHVRRSDWLWSGLQSLVEALLFYHPAVWWLGRRIRQEREHACDDLAVRACGDATALAEALAGLERAKRSDAALAANGGQLLQRVVRLLSPAPTRTRRAVLAGLGAIAVMGALLTGQVGVGGGQPHDVVLEASTTGLLGPGDYRQITANDGDTERFYRASADAEGRITEVYRENGRDRSIDAGVRAWLAPKLP